METRWSSRPKRSNGRRAFSVVCLLALCSAFALAGCGSNDESDGGSVKLKLADGIPLDHPVTAYGAKVFMEKAEEYSDGRITFQHFPAEQLVSAADTFEAVSSGTVDIAWVSPAYVTDALPEASVAELPWGEDIRGISEAYWEVLQSDVLSGLLSDNGVKAMWGFTFPPARLCLGGSPIKTRSDIHGLKVKTTLGLRAETIQALGMTPVDLPGAEMYPAMQRGTIDAVSIPISSIAPFSMDELVKSVLSNVNLASGAVFYAMNDASWEKLDADQQDALTRAADDAMASLNKYYETSEQKIQSELESQGIEFFEISASELEQWREATANVATDWAKNLDKRGSKGSEVLDLWLSLMDDLDDA